jgi:hypothetical protein
MNHVVKIIWNEDLNHLNKNLHQYLRIALAIIATAHADKNHSKFYILGCSARFAVGNGTSKTHSYIWVEQNKPRHLKK